MKMLKDRELDALLEAEYKKGMHRAVLELVKRRVLVYDESVGYGACMKTPIDLQSDTDIPAVLDELLSPAPVAVAS